MTSKVLESILAHLILRKLWVSKIDSLGKNNNYVAKKGFAKLCEYIAFANKYTVYGVLYEGVVCVHRWCCIKVWECIISCIPVHHSTNPFINPSLQKKTSFYIIWKKISFFNIENISFFKGLWRKVFSPVYSPLYRINTQPYGFTQNINSPLPLFPSWGTPSPLLSFQ